MAGYREAGRYAANPRAGGGLVNASFDAGQMIQLASRVVGEAAKMAAASKDAHTALAAQLQEDIALVLENAVDARGREQRAKGSQDRLGSAIRSDENRRVNVTGYTVGYLDSIAAVRPYYRGLEEGSDKHVGRYLAGFFSTGGVLSARPGRAGGLVSSLVRGGTDAQFIQQGRFTYEYPQFPGVRIKKRIKGYNYFSGGQDNFISRGGTTTLAEQEYVKAFERHGMDLLARAMNLNAGLPSRSGLSISQGDQRSSPR